MLQKNPHRPRPRGRIFRLPARPRGKFSPPRRARGQPSGIPLPAFPRTCPAPSFPRFPPGMIRHRQPHRACVAYPAHPRLWMSGRRAGGKTRAPGNTTRPRRPRPSTSGRPARAGARTGRDVHADHQAGPVGVAAGFIIAHRRARHRPRPNLSWHPPACAASIRDGPHNPARRRARPPPAGPRAHETIPIEPYRQETRHG